MRDLVLLFLTFMSIASSAEARMGATLDMCVRSYGKPLSEKKLGEYQIDTFKTDNIWISVTLYSGYVEAIEYGFPSESGFTRPNLKLIKAALEANSENNFWKYTPDTQTTTWNTTSGQLRAKLFDSQDGTPKGWVLEISSEAIGDEVVQSVKPFDGL